MPDVQTKDSQTPSGLDWIGEIAKRILDGGEPAGREEALRLIRLEENELPELLQWAGKLREAFKGDTVEFCSVVNAKSGACTEDCGFCAQSAFHNQPQTEVYPYLSDEKLLEAQQQAQSSGAGRFGIVTSGRGIAFESDEYLDKVCNSIRAMKSSGKAVPDASLGTLDRRCAKKLKEAGLDGYHHNLETSRRHFPNICTTHPYDEKIETIRIAKEAGFYTCSGGIFGMGETDEDRVDMGLDLRELGVDSIPMNFLIAVEGTAVSHLDPMPAWEILKIICVYRFLFPKKDLRVCGGRSQHLGDRQQEIFQAGANAAMVGNLLTTMGRSPEDDLKMVHELGLKVASSISEKF